jgi:hypothetical protein
MTSTVTPKNTSTKVRPQAPELKRPLPSEPPRRRRWIVAAGVAAAAAAAIGFGLIVADDGSDPSPAPSSSGQVDTAMARYGSVDAAERWAEGLESVSLGSPDAMEQWADTGDAEGPTGQTGSPDAIERWADDDGPFVEHPTTVRPS